MMEMEREGDAVDVGRGLMGEEVDDKMLLVERRHLREKGRTAY